MHRRVNAFASTVDAEHNVVFENFRFDPIEWEEEHSPDGELTI